MMTVNESQHDWQCDCCTIMTESQYVSDMVILVALRGLLLSHNMTVAK